MLTGGCNVRALLVAGRNVSCTLLHSGSARLERLAGSVHAGAGICARFPPCNCQILPAIVPWSYLCLDVLGLLGTLL